jgi:hypothetical protein
LARPSESHQRPAPSCSNETSTSGIASRAGMTTSKIPIATGLTTAKSF